MDCPRAEELLSDHVEGTLVDPLLTDLERHLATCPRCLELREAMAEVVDALRGFPVLEAPSDLADRAAAAALTRPRKPKVMTGWRTIPLRIQAIAALLAVVVTGAAIAATSRASTHQARRLAEHAVGAQAYILERKDRLVEDLRILRVVISTAFEGRLDRMSDRMDDYRRFLEKRRASDKGKKKRTEGIQVLGSAMVLAPGLYCTQSAFLLNTRGAPFVKVCVSDERPVPRGPEVTCG